MYICDQAGIVQRVAFNGGLADQVMIHSCNCSDLLVSMSLRVIFWICIKEVRKEL